MGKQSKQAFRMAGHIRIGKRRLGNGCGDSGWRSAWRWPCFMALALPVATFAANSNAVAVVRSSGADLYDAPDGAAIQSLARGSALEAIGRTADGAWLKVTTADGVTGWTPAARLVVFAVENLPALSDAQAKPAQSSAAAGRVAITSTVAITGTVTTVGESLNLRAGPGTDYAVIGARSPGEILALAGRNKSTDWLAVTLPDGKDIGWVSSSFVRAAGDPARLPITDRVERGDLGCWARRTAADIRSDRSVGEACLPGPERPNPALRSCLRQCARLDHRRRPGAQPRRADRGVLASGRRRTRPLRDRCEWWERTPRARRVPRSCAPPPGAPMVVRSRSVTSTARRPAETPASVSVCRMHFHTAGCSQQFVPIDGASQRSTARAATTGTCQGCPGRPRRIGGRVA